MILSLIVCALLIAACASGEPSAEFTDPCTWSRTVRTWNDANRNQQWDESETPFPAEITVLPWDDGSTVFIRTVSDTDGLTDLSYTQSECEDYDLSVNVTVPLGMEATTLTRQLARPQSDTPLDFGFVAKQNDSASELEVSCERHTRAFAWEDYDADGQLDDGEPPLSDVKIRAEIGGSGAATTQADGFADVFMRIISGGCTMVPDILMVADRPSGYKFTTPHSLKLIQGEPIQFGLLTADVIANEEIFEENCDWIGSATAWLDLNADGVRDNIEPPIEGIDFYVDDILNDVSRINVISASGPNGVAKLNAEMLSCPNFDFEVYANASDAFFQTTKLRLGHKDVQDGTYNFGFAPVDVQD